MIFPLVQDFADALAAMPAEHLRHRILKLLDEAIRRDVHFIERHPTTFFQCLWNSCWWFDSPSTPGHYLRNLDVPAEPVPTDLSSPLLYPLSEAMEARKSVTKPGFRWLKSIRPPETPLDLGQEAILYGHEGAVLSLVFVDDATLWSGSDDATVRVWDVRTGAHLACHRGPVLSRMGRGGVRAFVPVVARRRRGSGVSAAGKVHALACRLALPFRLLADPTDPADQSGIDCHNG